LVGWGDEENRARGKILFWISSFILVGCLEYRVIFTSLFHWVTLYPPWSYIVVTICLYSIFALVGLHFTGYYARKPTYMFIAMLAALAGSFVLGLPWYLFPFPLATVFGLVEFIFRRKLTVKKNRVQQALFNVFGFAVLHSVRLNGSSLRVLVPQ
jgi:hypothetical protein